MNSGKASESGKRGIIMWVKSDRSHCYKSARTTAPKQWKEQYDQGVFLTDDERRDELKAAWDAARVLRYPHEYEHTFAAWYEQQFKKETE